MNFKKSFQGLMNWNFDFAKRKFPKHFNDPIPPIHHLKEELKELIEELENAKYQTIERIGFEYADCLILLLGSAKRFGFTANELLNYCFRKMEINEKRNWGEPDENGVYKHKKE